MLFFNIDNFTCTSREIFSVGVHSFAVEGNCNNSLVVNLEVGMFDVHIPFLLFREECCFVVTCTILLQDREFVFFGFAGLNRVL